jgi:hypothetical protein
MRLLEQRTMPQSASEDTWKIQKKTDPFIPSPEIPPANRDWNRSRRVSHVDSRSKCSRNKSRNSRLDVFKSFIEELFE